MSNRYVIGNLPQEVYVRRTRKARGMSWGFSLLWVPTVALVAFFIFY